MEDFEEPRDTLDLDEHLGALGGDLPDDPTEWRGDDVQVNWLLRRLGKLENERAALEAIAQAEMSAVRDWLDGETKPLVRQIDNIRAALTAQAIENRRQGRTKVSVPAGELATRKGSDEYQVGDAALFVEWCEENGLAEFVRVKKEVALVELRKLPVHEVFDPCDCGAIEPDEEHADGCASLVPVRRPVYPYSIDDVVHHATIPVAVVEKPPTVQITPRSKL